MDVRVGGDGSSLMAKFEASPSSSPDHMVNVGFFGVGKRGAAWVRWRYLARLAPGLPVDIPCL